MHLTSTSSIGDAMDRSSIEAVALDLIAQRGFDAVKVQDICNACHITKPTFYHYIPSKDDLLVSSYHMAAKAACKLIDEAGKKGSCWERMVASFSVIFDEAERFGCEQLGRVLAMNIKERHGNVSRSDYMTERMVPLVREGQASGEFANNAEAELLYAAVADIFQGLEYLWCESGGSFAWREAFKSEAAATLGARATK